MINRIIIPTRFSRRTWLGLVGAIVLAGGCIVCLQREAMLSGLGRWLNVAGRLDQPVDAVMVLGGGASIRPFVAVEIVRVGMAGKILIPTIERSNDNHDGLVPVEHEIIRQIVLRSGISLDATVLLNSVVNSTEGEAQVAAAYLQAHPGERLAIVTSDYHTRRTRLMFSRACGSNAANLVFIGAPTDGFGASDWWRSERGLVSYISEYLKLVRALVHYGPANQHSTQT
jgi:uncharacterized SAM-binding protein YcdF (DUF218 family)